MAFFSKCARSPSHCLYRHGKREMTIEEFKKWLKKLDADKDGRITKADLQHAICVNGGWFSKWKARRAVKYADVNGNGYVDKDELQNLVEFAEKELRVKTKELDGLQGRAVCG